MAKDLITEVEKKIRKKLFKLQDEGYRDFTRKLTPNIAGDSIIGVRVPALRNLAKELNKENWEECLEYIQIIPHRYHEENILHGFLVERIKEIDEVLCQTERFLSCVDNWATCDIFAPPIFKKHTDLIYEKIKIWVTSEKTYTVRFGVVTLMRNYLDEKFSSEMIELVAGIKSEEYYINMAIAWYFATALSKQYDEAIVKIEERTLAKFVQNKSIQKAIESRRISDEKKDYLRTLKIV